MTIFGWTLSRQTPPAKDDDLDDASWFHAVSAAMSIGTVGIVVYSWAEKSWLVLSCALLVALAATLVGALAGFVFGIPRETTVPAATGAGLQERSSPWGYQTRSQIGRAHV